MEKTSAIKSDNSSSSGFKLQGKISRSKSVVESRKHVVSSLENSSCSPGEIVGLIDHALESIVLSLDRKTLLNCCLLSNHWAYLCTKAWSQYTFFDENITRQYPSFLNLQVFECSSQLPEVFVQQLLHCSPNLVEVSLPEEYLHNLVEPVDRVHLLKELKLGFRFFDYHPLDYVLRYYPDRLALHRISFNGSFYYHEFPTHAYLASFDFMRRLLEASAATCKMLRWNRVVKHFEILRMPQVTHIVFEINMIDGRPVSVFEKGVILGEKFPNLKLLEVQSDYYIVSLVPIGQFFGIYDNEPTPVTSVKNVVIRNFKGPQEYFRNFRHMFPNAFIHGWFITMLPARNQTK